MVEEVAVEEGGADSHIVADEMFNWYNLSLERTGRKGRSRGSNVCDYAFVNHKSRN